VIRKVGIMKYKGAITKAELLVMLVCIILAGLNFGGLSNAGRERARRMVCAVNMARLAQANHIYADNWDEWFCPPMMYNADLPLSERYSNWLQNPDFRWYTGLDEKQTWDDMTVMPKEYFCPTDKVARCGQVSVYDVLCSYAYNVTDWIAELNDYWNGTCTSPWQIGHKRTAIPRASGKINFADSTDWWCIWWGADYEDGWDIVGHGSWEDYGNVGIYGPVLYRHSEGANFAFYDGHVEHLPKEEAYINENGQDATGMWYVGEFPD